MRNASTGRRLLVVDDNHLILEMVGEFFEDQGYHVDHARTGTQALERLADVTPDAIVADVLMPEMDGWELYEEVRARSETARVPFVFLTTETKVSQRLRGLRIGADDYVTKPFHVEELHARVEALLRRRSAVAEEWPAADVLVAGSTEHLAIADLLQILSLNGKDVLVELRDGERHGQIGIAGGQIVHAAAGPVQGRKALYRMLGWTGTRFRVLPVGAALERDLELRTADALMDGLVSLDEWNRWSRGLPERDALLEPARGARKRVRSKELDPPEREVWAACRRGVRLGDLLDTSERPDGELARAVGALLERGALQARSADDEPAPLEGAVGPPAR